MPALPSLASVVTSPLLAFRAAALGHCSAAVKLATLRPTNRTVTFALDKIHNRQDRLLRNVERSSMDLTVAYSLKDKLVKVSQQNHALYLLEYAPAGYAGMPTFERLFESTCRYARSVPELEPLFRKADDHDIFPRDHQRSWLSSLLARPSGLQDEALSASPPAPWSAVATSVKDVGLYMDPACLTSPSPSASRASSGSVADHGGYHGDDSDSEADDFSESGGVVGVEATNPFAAPGSNAVPEPAPAYTGAARGIITRRPQLSHLKDGEKTPFSIPEFAQFEFGIIRTDRR